MLSDFLRTMEEIDYLGEKVIRWRRGASSFLACPERGARLMNWNIRYADGSVRDVIFWPDDLPNLEDIASVHGGNPILFPFCGRSFHNGENGFWLTPSGERRPMPIHGFARQSRFEIAHISDNGFSAKLLPLQTNRDFYPFRYEFTVSYRFEELTLYVELLLKNLDTVPIPWSAGHHFYFTLPWRERTSRTDYQIYIPAREAYRHGADGKLLPVPEFPQEDRFDSAGLRDRIHTDLIWNTCTFGPIEREEKIKIRIGNRRRPAEGTTFVVWTKDEDSPYYCVEPWMGPPNSPEHKRGLHFVEPGRTQSFLSEIHLEQP